MGVGEFHPFHNPMNLGASYDVKSNGSNEGDDVSIKLQDGRELKLKRFEPKSDQETGQLIQKIQTEQWHNHRVISSDGKRLIWYLIRTEDENVVPDESFKAMFKEMEMEKIPTTKVNLELMAQRKRHPVVQISFDTDFHDPIAMRMQALKEHQGMMFLAGYKDSLTGIQSIYLIPTKCTPLEKNELHDQIDEIEESHEGEHLVPETEGYVGRIITTESKDETRYINLAEEGRVLGKGGYGVVKEQEALFSPSGQAASTFGRTSVAAKSGRTQGESESLKNTWFTLTKKLGVDGVKMVRGIQPPFERNVEGTLVGTVYAGGDLSKASKNPAELKTQFAHQLIEGLFWIQLVGEPHADIKPENCLTKGNVAIISDHPHGKLWPKVKTSQEVDHFLANYKYPSRTDRYTDYNALIKMEEKIEEAKKHPERKVAALNEARQHFQQAQSFSLGATLYNLFTEDYPHPLIETENNRKIYFLHEPENVRSVEDQRNALQKGGCPADLIEMIIQLINPQSEERPKEQDLLPFILAHNPNLTGVINLLNTPPESPSRIQKTLKTITNLWHKT